MTTHKLSIVISGSFRRCFAAPEQVKKELLGRAPTDVINERSSVTMLQRYIRAMVARRGFDKETPQDVLLLFMEEVGELAKAMRRHLGLKTDQDKQERYAKLEGELADVFIYLLDLANLLDISLFRALYGKERENEKRSWS